MTRTGTAITSWPRPSSSPSAAAIPTRPCIIWPASWKVARTRFICRRLILSASEDVGLADPNALPLAVSCQQAVEFVGMPEGFIPLAETGVYLALARKSNSSYAAYLTAAREVKYNGARPVPLHLRNASTQLQKEWGYGKEYKYPHNYPDGWVEQDYLPAELVGRRFYQPRDMGDEARLSQWWRKIHKIRKTEES